MRDAGLVRVELEPLVVAELNEEALAFFRQVLPGSWVPGYLASRGFGADVQQKWQVGYAPAGWTALVLHLRRFGVAAGVMEAAGLVRRTRRGGLVDVFRDRAVIPVRDAAGRLAGFTGRAGDGAGAGVPRYLNSPRTVLYDKGAILFGLWESRAALAAGSVPVLTEGALDAVAVSASCGGRMAGVAPCGTALTARQARALGQVARLEEAGVRVAFDGDAAGLRGAVRAYRLLAPMAPRLSAVVLPPGQDPAGILSRGGPAVLADALETRSRPLADLVVDAELSQWGRWLGYETGRVSALHAVAAVVAGLRPDDIARQVARVADRLALDYDIVTSAVADAVSSAVGGHLNRPASSQEEDPAAITKRNRIR